MHICLEAFTVTEFNKIFLERQPYPQPYPQNGPDHFEDAALVIDRTPC